MKNFACSETSLLLPDIINKELNLCISIKENDFKSSLRFVYGVITSVDWCTVMEHWYNSGVGVRKHRGYLLKGSGVVTKWPWRPFRCWLYNYETSPHYIILWVCVQSLLLLPYRGIILRTSMVPSSSDKFSQLEESWVSCSSLILWSSKIFMISYKKVRVIHLCPRLCLLVLNYFDFSFSRDVKHDLMQWLYTWVFNINSKTYNNICWLDANHHTSVCCSKV